MPKNRAGWFEKEIYARIEVFPRQEIPGQDQGFPAARHPPSLLPRRAGWMLRGGRTEPCSGALLTAGRNFLFPVDRDLRDPMGMNPETFQGRGPGQKREPFPMTTGGEGPVSLMVR